MASLLLTLLLFIAVSIGLWTTMRLTTVGYSRYQDGFTTEADTHMERLFLFFDSRTLFLLNISALLLLPVIVFLGTGSPFYTLAVFLLVLLLPKFVYKRLIETRREKINAALPDALMQIASAMRAGATFLSAMESLVAETEGPISQEFSLALREQRMGATLTEALDNLGERVESEEMDLMITATQIAKEMGGNLAEILERLSLTLRRKLEMEGKIIALTAQGRLQGWVVSALPFLIIAALLAIEPETMRPIYESLLGWVFLGVIVVMEILGILMIRGIVNIDV
jgi:tight adherence protein B